MPILGAAYGRYFIGGVPGAGVPFGLGASLLQTERWRFGAALGGNLRNPREESDSSRLRGLGDIERTALASAFGSFTEGWFTARGAVITDIGGEDQGTRVSLDLEGRYSLTPALSLSAGPGLTWADGDYTQTFFGIDATQSARSGRPIYRADSGLNTLRFSLGADYRLTPQWSVSARAVASSLRGDAEDSPITDTSSQNLYSVFLSYRF